MPMMGARERTHRRSASSTRPASRCGGSPRASAPSARSAAPRSPSRRGACTRSSARTARASPRMIKILSGVEQADTGTIEFDGAPVRSRAPATPSRLGIATVYQEPQLFPELTVSENIFTGREIRKAGRVAWAEQNAKVVELLELLGLPARYATVPVGELSIAEQQQVSIAKSLAGDAEGAHPRRAVGDPHRRRDRGAVRGGPPAHRGRRRGHLHLAPARRAVPDRRRGDGHARRPDHRHLPDRRPRRPADRGADGRRDPLRRAAAPGDPGRRAGARARRPRPRRASSTTSPSRSGRARSSCLYGLVGSGVSEIAACVYGIDRADQRPRCCCAASRSRPRSPQQAQKLRHRAAAREPQGGGDVQLPVDRVQHLGRPPQAAVAARRARRPRPASARSPTT